MCSNVLPMPNFAGRALFGQHLTPGNADTIPASRLFRPVFCEAAEFFIAVVKNL
jgi:hypothetical protein